MAATSERGRRADELARRYVDGDTSVGEELAREIKHLVSWHVKRTWRSAGCRCKADVDDYAGWLWWSVWKYLGHYDGRHALSTYLGQCFLAGRTAYQYRQTLVTIPRCLTDSPKQMRRAPAEYREAAERAKRPVRGDAALRDAADPRSLPQPEPPEESVLRLIPDADREFLLSLAQFGGELTHQDIARQYDVSLGSALNRVKYALRRARVALESAGITGPTEARP